MDKRTVTWQVVGDDGDTLEKRTFRKQDVWEVVPDPTEEPGTYGPGVWLVTMRNGQRFTICEMCPLEGWWGMQRE